MAEGKPWRVAVFGGSSVPQDSEEYRAAYRLGRRLAQAGFAVVTGGYIGTMEAVSKGAHEAGGHVIGVPCEAIERWRPVGPNPWIHEMWTTRTLLERLKRIMHDTHAAVVLPGGIGTLTELALYWNQLLVQELSPRPLIVVGDGWHRVLKTLTMAFPQHFTSSVRRWWLGVPHVDAAVEALVVWRKIGWEGLMAHAQEDAQ